MTWDSFSAEACLGVVRVSKLYAAGRSSEALGLMKQMLADAYRLGPSEMPYDRYEELAGKEMRELADEVELMQRRAPWVRLAADHRRLAEAEVRRDVREAHERFARDADERARQTS